jgi:hypothetical protein
MFVLVVATSLMNPSIAAVVRDLDTTVSGVQSAIALEALVSAAVILVGSKVGNLIGRQGLLGYAVGALGDEKSPTGGQQGLPMCARLVHRRHAPRQGFYRPWVRGERGAGSMSPQDRASFDPRPIGVSRPDDGRSRRRCPMRRWSLRPRK